MFLLHLHKTRGPRCPNLFLIRSSHFNPPSLEPPTHRNTVAVFWDLDNKPPSPIPPYEAALRLKRTASSLGFVGHMIAYASRHARSSEPESEPYRCCGVCGRRFYNEERLVNHFKSVHERENAKRVSQIESARGSRRVNLAAKYSMKMDKFRRASGDILVPSGGSGFGDGVERAGFRVRRRSGDGARDIVELMEEGRVGCLVLVSDDPGFAGVLHEAKARSIRTVVIGNKAGDEALRRAADGGFSWREVVAGKAVSEAVSVLGRWRDRDVLRRLEWSYDRKAEKSLCGGGEEETDSPR